MANRTDKRRFETRQSLLAAAREVFARIGVEEARIQDITEAADLGVGTFYTHFSSKHELVEAIAGEVLAQHEQAILRFSEKVKDPVAIGIVAGRALFESLRRQPETRWLIREPQLLVDQILKAIRPHTDLVWSEISQKRRAELNIDSEAWMHYGFWGMVGLLNAQERGRIAPLDDLEDQFLRIHMQQFGVTQEQMDAIDSEYREIAETILRQGDVQSLVPENNADPSRRK